MRVAKEKPKRTSTSRNAAFSPDEQATIKRFLTYALEEVLETKRRLSLLPKAIEIELQQAGQRRYWETVEASILWLTTRAGWKWRRIGWQNGVPVHYAEWKDRKWHSAITLTLISSDRTPTAIAQSMQRVTEADSQNSLFPGDSRQRRKGK